MHNSLMCAFPHKIHYLVRVVKFVLHCKKNANRSLPKHPAPGRTPARQGGGGARMAAAGTCLGVCAGVQQLRGHGAS